jgi:D-alanine-D-alanine ligase
MRVGLTYDLRDDYLALGFSQEETAEFDRTETIDAIAETLGGLGHVVERIGHARALMARLLEGKNWDLVFNIAEGQYGLARESLVPALLDAHTIPYTFSDPFVLALALHKATCKRVVRDLGLPTPDFAVVECASDLERIDLPFPLFAKPLAEGTSKGISAHSRITDQPSLRRRCCDLLQRFRQPVLLETYLPGREVTVGIVGTGPQARVVGVMEVLLGAEAEAGVYSLENKERYEELVTYRLVPDNEPLGRDAAALALGVWRGLGCRDGGRVDLREDAQGRASFIEVNPLAGLHPVHSDLPIMGRLAGWTYRDILEAIMSSALERRSAGER